MRDSLRVLEITVRADHGGGPRHLEILMRGCQADVRFFVACPEEEPYCSRFVSITHQQVFAIPHRALRVGALLRLASCVRLHAIQLIHSHGRGAGVYARLLTMLTGVPWVHTPHGAQGGDRVVNRAWYNGLFENLTSGPMRHVIFVSEDERIAATGSRLWQRVPYSVIRNGVLEKNDRDRDLVRVRVRADLALDRDDFVVATISRFNYQKNMDDAYRIACAMPDVTFLWLGDGPDRGEIMAKARARDCNNIRFIQQADSSDGILAAADAYLSTSRWEGLPLSVLEAMAMRLPVVLSDVVGHRDIIRDDEVGVTFPLHDIDVAIKTLRMLKTNLALRLSWGINARALQSRDYSSVRMCRDIISVYRNVVGGQL